MSGSSAAAGRNFKIHLGKRHLGKQHFKFTCCIFSGDFLKTLEDPDLNVRRVALVTFNSAAHNKPSLIRDLLDTVLPHLYNETKVRKELIREVK